MFRSIPGLARNRRAIATAVVASIVSISAACSDSSTAPDAPIARPVDGASAIVLKLGATIKVRVIDTAGVQLKETGWVQFTTANDTVYVQDNSAKDHDPATGVVKVMMLKNQTFKACFSLSQHYRGDLAWNSPWPRCATKTSSASEVDLGSVYARESPMVTFVTKNQFGLVGGASFTLTVPAQNWSLTIADGQGSYDESKGADGKIVYTLGYPNAYTWCETSAPSKNLLLSQKCGSFDAKYGQKYQFVLMHEQLIY
jgi:hypothetical protein